MKSTTDTDVLTTDRWLALVNQDHSPGEEEPILVIKLKAPYTLYISRNDVNECFTGFNGIELDIGQEIRVVGSTTGRTTIDLPEHAVQQLGLTPNDYVCISRKRDDDACWMKRFELKSSASEVPSRVIVDSFTPNQVTRTHYSRTDIDSISTDELRALAAKMGGFRYDPFTPLVNAGGRVGFLFRRTFKEDHTEADENFLFEYKRNILASQWSNGSWEDNLVMTAFNLIRLVEVGETVGHPAIEKAARWLLSSPEPARIPGLFMATVELTGEFNEWKNAGGSRGRSIYDRVNKGNLAKYRPIRDTYCQHLEVVPGICELSLLSPSVVVVNALLRLGFASEKRVKIAINTLLQVWSGRWCGCGLVAPDREVCLLDGEPDFDSGFTVPSDDKTIYHSDWFTSKPGLLHITGKQKFCAYYSWLQVGKNQALIEKHSVGMGNCTLGVHEALSYHPDYAGSNLETIAALEFSRRQSASGYWGDTPRSMMLQTLARLSHPLATFLVLRSIPGLIRDQHPDGLWNDYGLQTGPVNIKTRIRENTADEVVTLRILLALKRFDFLDSLLRNR